MWQTVVNDTATNSYAFLLNSCLTWNLNDLYDKACLLPWVAVLDNDRNIKRYSCWMTFGGCDCPYTYGGQKWIANKAPTWLEDLTRCVNKLCNLPTGINPNGVNCKKYDTAKQALGWHSDAESLLRSPDGNCIIISLTLGGSRQFSLRQNSTKEHVAIESGNGDLFIMAGMMQHYYKHSVLASKGLVQEVRINFIWRFIYNHISPCRLPRQVQAIEWMTPFITGGS